ncbi:MAG: hypothetical protein WCX69_01015 [Candidatus Paceibacterota bacterium]
MPNKIQIPKKTKIAAWILLSLAAYGTLLLAAVLPMMISLLIQQILVGDLSSTISTIIAIIQSVVVGLLYWVVPSFLLKLNARIWKIGVIFLAVIVCYNFATLSGNQNHQGSSFAMMWGIIALVLLYSDKKNYFAAVEKAKNKTN